MSPRWIMRPTAVPRITAIMTAGMFSISVMEEIPIPIAQMPKIEFSPALKCSGSLCPHNAPARPPKATASTFTIIPIIIDSFTLVRYGFSLKFPVPVRTYSRQRSLIMVNLRHYYTMEL